MKLIKAFACVALGVILLFSIAGCSQSGNVKFKDKYGNEYNIGNTKWDKSKMHGLPAPKANLISLTTTAQATVYTFDKMAKEDAKNYIETIKSAGFTYEAVTIGEYVYTGQNGDGLIFSFTYDENSGTGTVSAASGDRSSE